MERDGSWYCGTHDPVKVAERRAAKEARWEAKWAAIDAQKQREERINTARERVILAARQVAASELHGVEMVKLRAAVDELDQAERE